MIKKRLFTALVVLVLVLSGCGSDAPQQQAEAAVNEVIVYVTDTGEKYHREWCNYLISSHPIRLSSALRSGYTPCSRCSPPR